jgi:hypothetical protein
MEKKEEKGVHVKVDDALPESPTVAEDSRPMFKFVEICRTISRAEMLAEMEKRGLPLATEEELSVFIKTRLAEVRRFGTEARDSWDEYCCLCVFRE